MKEEWRDVVGYEGYYMVSSNGRIKNNSDYIFNPYTTRDGYKIVWLKPHGRVGRGYLVHRLVAIAFIDNPLNKSQVNHIDMNKLNNIVSNLEWVSQLENMTHARKNGVVFGSPKRPVIRNDGVVFDSCYSAARECGGKEPNVRAVCIGKKKYCKGFKFSYIDGGLNVNNRIS